MIWAYILSAGKSARIRGAGFSKQKSMLPLKDGKTILEWQANSLQEAGARRIHYITRMEYFSEEEDVFRRVANSRNLITRMIAVLVTEPTRGPLDGLWSSSESFLTENEIIIQYNDEFVKADTLRAMINTARDMRWDAALLGLSASKTRERYTQIPNSNLVAGCTYYFRSGHFFFNTIRSLERGPSNGVPDAVYSAGNWGAFHVQDSDVIEIGVPEEYFEYTNSGPKESIKERAK